MKYLKKLCSVALIIIVIGATTLLASAAENYIVLYGFAFDINSDNEAVIHSYDDRAEEVVIPQKLMDADVVMIDDYAFFGDEVITSVSFNNAKELKKIGVNAFYGCTRLSGVEIPEWVEELSFGAFQNCSSLAALTIHDGISEIPPQCFYGCTSLDSVAIPQSVTVIGDRAFMDCCDLSAVMIPDTVTQIADNAFDGCDDLVIYCTTDSYAQTYASAHKIVYVLTDVEPAVLTYLIGDSDHDGVVSVIDATAIQRKLVDLHVGSFFARAADIGGDGLNILDATRIQRYLAEFEDPYHIGEIVSCSAYGAQTDYVKE